MLDSVCATDEAEEIEWSSIGLNDASTIRPFTKQHPASRDHEAAPSDDQEAAVPSDTYYDTLTCASMLQTTQTPNKIAHSFRAVLVVKIIAGDDNDDKPRPPEAAYAVASRSRWRTLVGTMSGIPSSSSSLLLLPLRRGMATLSSDLGVSNK